MKRIESIIDALCAKYQLEQNEYADIFYTFGTTDLPKYDELFSEVI